MTKTKTITPQEFLANQGEPYYSRWFTIDQQCINVFADVTQDRQFIHCDPKEAAKTPFGSTIAHGFLSLSLLSAMVFDARPRLSGVKMDFNYGFNKIRFTAPVAVDSKVRGKFTIIKSAKKGEDRILITTQVNVEIEGKGKPALMAEWLDLMVLEEPHDGE